jgi:hypothetical protein
MAVAYHYYLFFAALITNAVLAQCLYPGPFGKNRDYVTGVAEWTVGSKQTLK